MKTDKNSFLITALPILSMITSIIPGLLFQNSMVEIIKVAVLTLVLTAIAAFYIRANASDILTKQLSKTIIIVGYLSSICLLLVVPKPYLYCFFLLGILLIAMLVDNKLAMLFHFSLSVIMAISLSTQPELVILVLVLGVMLCLLAGALRSKATVVYASIIILSTNVTLSFVINNFIFDKDLNFNYLNSLFSILAVLVTAFLLCRFYDTVLGTTQQNPKAFSESAPEPSFKTQAEAPPLEIIASTGEPPSSNEREIVAAEQETVSVMETRPSYDVLCSEENELLKQLKDFSEIIYSHSVQIADLSSRAAKIIGVDELLAKAGGLYHEIGKLKGKNYIEEGLKLAEEYSFPKELKAILKEHNIKYDKPSSIEAAIVMLSDNLVSTMDYIEKSEDHRYSTNKVIDNVFQMRVDKGTFDGINLSLKDFKLLKEFYEKEFCK